MEPTNSPLFESNEINSQETSESQNSLDFLEQTSIEASDSPAEDNNTNGSQFEGPGNRDEDEDGDDSFEDEESEDEDEDSLDNYDDEDTNDFEADPAVDELIAAKKKKTPKRPAELVRLNKLIADRGLASRRGADKMIEDGQITVNGKKVYELGIKVDPVNDRISVSGKPLRGRFENLYIMFHKPKGVLTTMEDPLNRPTVADFIGEVPTRVFPIGRLDWDSEGLLLLTNDGDYANKITHPKAEVTKTYLVKVNGKPTDDKLQKLKNGVTIVGGKVSAKSIEKVKRGKDQYDWLKIVITEGKNRQIRQMFEKIGFDVLKLQRVGIGRLRLGNLDRGEMVYLNETAAERVFMPDLPEELKLKKAQGLQKRAQANPRKKSFRKSTRDASSSYEEKGSGKRPSFKKSGPRKTFKKK